MNIKFIRMSILLFFLLQAGTIMAQRNIFRPSNVKITTEAQVIWGGIANINDDNTGTDVEFQTPASGTVELLMECVVAEKVVDYIVNYYYASNNPSKITLLGSQNSLTWTEIDSRSVSQSSNLIKASVVNQISYKYYKFIFEGITGRSLDIREIGGYSGVLSPPELTVTPGTTGNVANLSWTQEIHADGNYEIYRSTDQVNFTLIKTVARFVTSLVEDTLKRNTPYWYKIRAKSGEVYSNYSNTQQVVTISDVLVSGPSLFAVASATSSNIAELSWSLPIGGPGHFELERSLNGIDFTLLQTFDKGVSDFEDTTLTHNTAYWYRIRAINEVSTSPYSVIREITTLNDALILAPTLQVLAPTGTQAILTWDLAFFTEGGFELEKSINGTDFTPMGKVDKAVKTYTEESLSPNTDYWYRVRAYNYLGNSPYSTVVKVTTNSIKGLPADITDDGGILTVSADNSSGANANEGSLKLIDNSVATKWLVFNSETGQNLSAVYQPTGAYIVTGYAIGTANDSPARDPRTWRFEGSDDLGNWTVLDTRTNQLGSQSERLTLYNYSIANPGTKAFKYYRIAFTSNNLSNDIVRYQISEWQILGLDANSPEIPAVLTASNATVNSLDLTWTQDNSKPVSEYRLERSEDGLYYSPLETLTAPLLKYTDQNLYDGATYYYRLKAIGDQSTAVSGWSNVAIGKTLSTAGLPLSPAHLTASAVTDTTINLKWTDRSSDETSFSLERSRDNITFEQIKSLPTNTTAFKDETVWPGTYFYYRVSAINDKVKSSYSNVVKVLTTGINTAPLSIGSISPLQVCLGTGEFKMAINGISPGPKYESIQKLNVTGVKAADEESAKFFSSFSFEPDLSDSTIFETGSGNIETNGKIATFSFRTTGIAVAGDSAMVLVTIKDDGGTEGFASDSTEFPVKVYFNPLTVAITSDKGIESVSRYAVINLTASSNFPEHTTYQWAAADGIEGSRNGIKLRVKPKQTTTYTLTATTPNGCSTTASITLTPQKELVVTNVLTPNLDGKNDTWIVWGLENYANNEVKVFDRQGRIVFSKKGYNNDWDGTYNGSVLTQGGYYYVVETSDGKKIEKHTGVLTIVK